MKKVTVRGVLHFLAFVASNGAILAFVPSQYKELATVVSSFIIGVSAFFDTSHGDKIAGR